MAIRLSVYAASVLAALLAAVAAPAALGSTTFPDRNGDVEGGAGPDIVAVTVSSSPTTVTFRVRFATAPPLRLSTREGWVDMVLLGIDVPPLGPKPAPSGWRGADYALGTHGADRTITLIRAVVQAKGAGWKKLASLPLTTSGSTLRFSVPRSRLGSPAWFDFTVTAGRETAAPEQGGGADSAPDSGAFRFRLTP